jgi:hypothetical protein
MVKRHKIVRRGRTSFNEQTSGTISQVRDILNELHTLLSDYSPTWFTQAHYERTEEALRGLNRLIPSR